MRGEGRGTRTVYLVTTRREGFFLFFSSFFKIEDGWGGGEKRCANVALTLVGIVRIASAFTSMYASRVATRCVIIGRSAFESHVCPCVCTCTCTRTSVCAMSDVR